MQYESEPIYEECDCGRGRFDASQYHSCYTCYLERRESYLNCIFCGRWHSPEYATCYKCRLIPQRDEAGRNLRLDILLRDEFTCQNCGSCGGVLQVDHIEPCARGGSANPWNLQVLCNQCNRIKGAEYDWRWMQRRFRLMHLYFTFGWRLLDQDERQDLVADAYEYRSEFSWHAHYQQSLTGSAVS